MFDAEKFRLTKAQECSRFAAAAADVDDRLFWSRLAEGDRARCTRLVGDDWDAVADMATG
jgi:hypothetical protein